jgi:FtsP/CotA-like multicopper oxidase with cupredoxin domain
MGRFGNVMLVAGEPDLALEAKQGEVVRFYFTNTANTRVFNVTLPGAQMKLVGADAGHYEHEELVDEVLLAPSERVVVDVLFPDTGELELQHKTPERTYRLASIAVVDEQPEQSFADDFPSLRTNRDMAELRGHVEPFFKAPPDKSLSFTAEMDMGRARGRARRLRLPDAPRGRERGARQLPQVRHEAARPGGRRDHLRLPDAPGGDEQ